MVRVPSSSFEKNDDSLTHNLSYTHTYKGVHIFGSICLLILCHLDASLIGFEGLKSTIASSLSRPSHLVTQLLVWSVTCVFAVQCFVEFANTLKLWQVATMIVLDLLVTNLVAMVLAPLDLSCVSGGPPAPHLPPRERRLAARVVPRYDDDDEEEGEAVREPSPSFRPQEDGDDVAIPSRSSSEEEESLSLLPSPPTPSWHRYVFATGLASTLLLNLFFLCYDAAVIALRAAYRMDDDDGPRTKALLLLSSLASVWYRAFHARFCYHKLLFPSSDVLVTRFPRIVR